MCKVNTELSIQVLNPFLCCCPLLGKYGPCIPWCIPGVLWDFIKIMLKLTKGHAFLRMQGYVLLAFLASSEETHFTDRTGRTRKPGDRAAGHMSRDRVIETSQHLFKGK